MTKGHVSLNGQPQSAIFTPEIDALITARVQDAVKNALATPFDDTVKKDVGDNPTLEETLTIFFSECCVIAPQIRVKVKNLYKAYVTWCQANNKPTSVSPQAFGRQLSQYGFKSIKGAKGVRCRTGIGLARN